MYSNASIELLRDRIGWPEILPSGHSITLNEDVKKKNSGRTFDSFHALITPENVYYAFPEVNVTNEDFNKYLLDVKTQAVHLVLTRVMNMNPKYVDSQDYDAVISEKRHLFDEPIGYAVACQMIELFISTARSNFVERNAKFAYQNLKIELEGARNERGYRVATGLKDKLNQSIKRASEIIFPIEIIIQKADW